MHSGMYANASRLKEQVAEEMSKQSGHEILPSMVQKVGSSFFVATAGGNSLVICKMRENAIAVYVMA